MLAGELEEGIRLGSEALAMAEELGLDETRAAALNNIGTSRASLGDARGLEELEQAIEVAHAALASFELCRAKGNLAAQLWYAGELERANVWWREADEDAIHTGQLGFGRWFRGIQVDPAYALGDWDEGLARGQAFIATVEAGEPHYLASLVYSVRGLIVLGRDNVQSARADLEHSLLLARRAPDPQSVMPALARLAHVAYELGDDRTAAECIDEYLELIAGHEVGHGFVSTHVASWTATALGRGDELAAALAGRESPWVDAAIASASGDPVRAADICAAMGALTEEAYARLVASRLLLEQGRRAEALEQRDRALAFYRTVGATRYVRAAESLVALSA
jgi:tetratricopeptide (TPR) repeat protein